MSDRKPAPAQGGPTEVFMHERASATPNRSRQDLPQRAKAPANEADSPAARTEASPLVPLALSLRAAQTWFADAVTHPESAAGGHAEGSVDRVLTSTPRLSALERLGIYHHAYRARLIECLVDDYPALVHAIGYDAFEALASDYVKTHPSHGPNLNSYGAGMAAYCHERARATETDFEQSAFAASLASLEWALVEVLHAPDAVTLAPEALTAIPPERWGDARLPKSKGVRLVQMDYPANAYFQAFRNDANPKIPAPRESATAVYRQGNLIWRMDLTPAMAALLTALFEGATLGAALEAIEAAVETTEALAEAERNVMVWFREWVASGFFAGLELQGA